jgi:hypothetical protein
MSPNAQVRGLDDQNVKDDHGMISPNPYSRGSFQTPVAKVPKKKKESNTKQIATRGANNKEWTKR